MKTITEQTHSKDFILLILHNIKTKILFCCCENADGV